MRPGELTLDAESVQKANTAGNNKRKIYAITAAGVIKEFDPRKPESFYDAAADTRIFVAGSPLPPPAPLKREHAEAVCIRGTPFPKKQKHSKKKSHAAEEPPRATLEGEIDIGKDYDQVRRKFLEKYYKSTRSTESSSAPIAPPAAPSRAGLFYAARAYRLNAGGIPPSPLIPAAKPPVPIVVPCSPLLVAPKTASDSLDDSNEHKSATTDTTLRMMR